VVPNADLKLWHVWRGAVLAGLLFVVLNQMFPLYLRLVGGGFAAYQALGVFLLLMTWFYFLGMILCSGALLNAVLTGHVPEAAVEDEAPAPSDKDAERRAAEQAARDEAAERGPFKVLAWAG